MITLLDSTKLTKHTNWPVILLTEIDSTNLESIRRIRAGDTSPFLLLAESQSAGRGRNGKEWVSPANSNLYYTLAYDIPREHALDGFSLIVGLALLDALKQMGVADLSLKWPNDILVNESCKLAGILVEVLTNKKDSWTLVIGIGVNVNSKHFESNIDQKWSSLFLELGLYVDRNELVIKLNCSLKKYLEIYLQLNFTAFVHKWNECQAWHGRNVVLTTGCSQIEGILVGVDSVGAICLNVSGSLKAFHSGSLRLKVLDDS